LQPEFKRRRAGVAQSESTVRQANFGAVANLISMLHDVAMATKKVNRKSPKEWAPGSLYRLGTVRRAWDISGSLR
jgi:hypothetical protein